MPTTPPRAQHRWPGGSALSRRSRGSRRAVWRRGQARRVLAALSAAVAVWLVVTALRPAPPETGVPVLVAAADVPVGTVLEAADVQVVRVPERVVPGGALEDPAAVIGRVSGGPLRSRAVLTDQDLAAGSLADGLGPDVVVAHVSLVDAALAAAVGPGTRVDVLALLDGTTLAADVPVVATDAGDTSGVFVAVSSVQAAALARSSGAEMTGGVTLVLHPTRTADPG
ncbi:MAG: SAF domain-containing protein [Ornithinimicrobium sp.]|uniref:SAF domain-containing protein n=1 Tax=Ornithinimicrobium sp. TaxID=1977084 RepID=UPI003D9BE94F